MGNNVIKLVLHSFTLLCVKGEKNTRNHLNLFIKSKSWSILIDNNKKLLTSFKLSLNELYYVNKMKNVHI